VHCTDSKDTECTRSVRRKKVTAVRLAFAHWTSHATASISIRGRIGKALVRWALTTTVQVFCTWLHQNEYHKRLRAVVIRMLLSWRIRVLKLGLHLLQDHARQQRHMQKVCSKVVTHLMCRSLAVAFDRWREHEREQRRTAHILFRGLVQWRHRVYLGALDRWNEHVNAQRRIKHVCIRVVLHVKHRGLASSWDAWWQSTISQRRAGTQMVRVLKRWCSRIMLGAFEHWSSWAYRKMSEKRRLDRISICMQYILRRLQQAAANNAWNIWKSFERRRCSLRREMLNVSKCMNHKRMAISFRTWFTNHMDLSWRRKLLHKALQQVAFSSVGTAFGIWSMNAQLARIIRIRLSGEARSKRISKNLHQFECRRIARGQSFLREALQV